jgi:hypothetical protein
VLLDGLARDDGEYGVGTEIEEERGRLDELNFEAMRVESANGDAGGIFDLACGELPDEE